MLVTVPVRVPVVGVRVKFCVVVLPAVTETLFTVTGLKPVAEAVTLSVALGVTFEIVYVPLAAVVVEPPPEIETVAPEIAPPPTVLVTVPVRVPVVAWAQPGRTKEPMRVCQLPPLVA